MVESAHWVSGISLVDVSAEILQRDCIPFVFRPQLLHLASVHDGRSRMLQTRAGNAEVRDIGIKLEPN